MAVIKLFSGMDFSGKSTIINAIDQAMPGIFKCQQKFLTPIQTLQNMIDNGIWIPRDSFIPLLRKMVVDDIKNYSEDGLILQDTLWIIKFTSKLLVDGQTEYGDKIKEFFNLINCYPDMDSFYITASMSERKQRYIRRVQNGERISRSDRLLFSGNLFEEVEKYYKNIVFERFPDTKIIDTTNQPTKQIVSDLKKDKIFMGDLLEEKYGD